jgi:hypothetical protein
MGNLTQKILTLVVLLSVFVVTTDASSQKGQRLYIKKLKNGCKMNASVIAAKHSTAEWEELNNKGEIMKEIQELCPDLQENILKQKDIPHYFDFFKAYSNDSGSVPSC